MLIIKWLKSQNNLNISGAINEDTTLADDLFVIFNSQINLKYVPQLTCVG
jgi:hypothetical protein